LSRLPYGSEKTPCVIDGEAVVLGPDGISDFKALHDGKHNVDVRLYAFDLLMDVGVDMRDQTLQIRKLWLGKLLKRSGDASFTTTMQPVRLAIASSRRLARGAGRHRLKAQATGL
jgi:ATP-dependent DNA ligase